MYIRRKVFSISERRDEEIEKAFSKGYTDYLKKVAEDAKVLGESPLDPSLPGKVKESYLKRIADLIKRNPGKTALAIGGTGAAAGALAYLKNKKNKKKEEKEFSELLDESYEIGCICAAQKEFSKTDITKTKSYRGNGRAFLLGELAGVGGRALGNMEATRLSKEGKLDDKELLSKASKHGALMGASMGLGRTAVHAINNGGVDNPTELATIAAASAAFGGLGGYYGTKKAVKERILKAKLEKDGMDTDEED